MESHNAQPFKVPKRAQASEADEDTQKRRAIQRQKQMGTLERRANYRAPSTPVLVSMPIPTQIEPMVPQTPIPVESEAPNAETPTDLSSQSTEKLLGIELPSASQEEIQLDAFTNLDTAETTTIQEHSALDQQHAQCQLEAESRERSVSTMPQTPSVTARPALSRGKTIGLVLLLLIVLLNATSMSFEQFIGPQGWAFVLGGPGVNPNQNLITDISRGLKRHVLTPGATAQATPTPLTPQQFVSLIDKNMTLDQKLGQMMLVQFTGSDYSLDLSEMVSQYDVGAVLLFLANGNIINKSQLTNLTKQIQKNANGGVPLLISIDQEGGTVDRLINLDGARHSATWLGQTNDPPQARAAGVQDARDLSSYGINLNLAPVVDVTNVYNSQMYDRTFGTTAATVIKMAGAYLQGLQQSGQVMGVLKHFPGLGDVSGDPHKGIFFLKRPLGQLQAIDWAPYRSLISQGNVHAIMVTHEIVTAVDSNQISSLSPKMITGVLRNQLGFQGVVMTDSLTMDGITERYDEAQASVLAIQAGADLLMGPISALTLGKVIRGLKQAISSGQISMQRIDESVQRLLMLKYQMGLITIPQS